MEHISIAVMRDFLSVQLPREEVRRVVRHLLTQCPACASTARRSLRPAKFVGRESPGRPGDTPAALSSAVDRFLQRLEAALAGVEGKADA